MTESMDRPQDRHHFWLVGGLSLGLLLMGLLRWSGQQENLLTPLAGLATPGYILITAVFTTMLVRRGLPLNKLGFGVRPDLRQLLIVIAAIAVLRLFAVTLHPLIEELLGSGRNLERFSDVEGSTASFWALMLTNWTFAAFGEEFAYRIILMRGLAFVFGDSRKAQIYALLLQAVLFGLVHAYQGPTGIIGASISGLIFGTVVLLARWSIWPAAVVHGTNNTFGIIELYQG